MANIFGQDEQNDKSGWNNNKEMNPAANSSVTDEGLQSSEEHGDTSWRDSDVNKESGDPGRTPGKAEGEDDPEYTGNQ